MDYKRLPYGVADYTWIKSQNRYCADKTMFIPKMEEAGDFLYLIRPRRFGKSVFLTMLQAYYDIEKKDSFHTTFKDTWIESHPTEGLGKYQVLYFDFSRAAAGQGSLEETSIYIVTAYWMASSKSMLPIMMKISTWRNTLAFPVPPIS